MLGGEVWETGQWRIIFSSAVDYSSPQHPFFLFYIQALLLTETPKTNSTPLHLLPTGALKRQGVAGEGGHGACGRSWEGGRPQHHSAHSGSCLPARREGAPGCQGSWSQEHGPPLRLRLGIQL